MTGPTATPDRSGSRLRALLATFRDDPLGLVAAVAVVLGGGVVTFLWIPLVAWPALTADLAAVETTVVATTPWDVVLLQATVALAVGLVLGVELLGYRARDVLLGSGWSRFPLSAGPRWALVAAGVALFPFGAVVGYEQVFPVLLDALASTRWTVVAWGRIAAAVAVASGLAAQGALVAAVLAYGRGGRPETAPDAGPS